MNKFLRLSLVAAAVCGVSLMNSCSDNPALPANAVEFQSSELGFTTQEPELLVTITLSRAADADGAITVGLNATGVAYDTDFTTDPAAVNKGAIVLNVPAGATQATFKVLKKDAASFEGDETIGFRINYTDGGLSIGEKNELTVKFGEIVAVAADMKINGAANHANRVFIDLSANRQTSVSRSLWDLGFSSKVDEFRVYLNSVNKMVAKVTSKTDITAVTAADTTGLGVQLSLDAVFAQAASVEDPNTMPDWAKTATAWIDIPTDLTKTAIAAISATDSENKVYIINRGTGIDGKDLGWKKVRVLRNGTGYTLQHADIASATFTTVNVTKNNSTNLNYVSFANGPVTVEPATASWDFAWTGLTNTTNFGPGTPSIPYYFQDMIISNTNGVTVAVYNTNATTTKTYDTFAEGDIAALTFSGSQTAIGSSWRTTGGPPPSPAAGVTANRFYIVKDADGNYYKVQFTALVDDTNQRGFPSFKFALVKKGA